MNLIIIIIIIIIIVVVVVVIDIIIIIIIELMEIESEPHLTCDWAGIDHNKNTKNSSCTKKHMRAMQWKH